MKNEERRGGQDTEVTELGPAALDALLDRGDLEAWAPLLRAVARDPWGPLAERVLRLCEAHPMYGTSALWRAWIERRRRGEAVGDTTLAEARGRAGMTQSEVAERMGVSQSDVSRLERRDDLLLSTLRRYAEAIGGRLSCGWRVRGRWTRGRCWSVGGPGLTSTADEGHRTGPRRGDTRSN